VHIIKLTSGTGKGGLLLFEEAK